MKKLVIMLALGAIMISCNTKPTKVENPKQETTVELQQLASIDSITYKVVEKDNTVYILCTKDNTVVKKVSNDSGVLGTDIIFLIVLMFGLFLIAIFKD
jgi:hypothetical protein